MRRRRFLGLCAAGVGLTAAGCASDGRDIGSSDGADDPTGPSAPEVDRTSVVYGDHADAFADLWVPANADGPVPVVVLVHGGFWQQQFRLDLMDPLAAAVAGLGFAAWNIEYRRLGGGGGYPETFDDVAAAFDHLAGLDDDRLDVSRVAAVGHSAGGHLAVWAASRSALDGGPWSSPAIVPEVTVSLAGVLDLAGCVEQGLGGGSCAELVGGSRSEVPDRVARTSPVELVPSGSRVVAVHGSRDTIVPLEQSRTYVDAAVAAGGDAELVVVDGDHFDVIDPAHASWDEVAPALRRLS